MSKFNELYQNFKSLELLKRANENSFETFTKYICSKNVVISVKNLLEYLENNYRVINITAKEVISSYTIGAYDNIVLNSERTPNDIKVYNQAKIIVNSLENNLADDSEIIDKFITDLQTYKKNFNEWKNDDKQIIIDSLVRSYHELVMSSETVDTSGVDFEEFHENIGRLKQQILNDLKKIGGEEALKEINNYQPYTVMFDEKTVGEIQSTMKMVFWDKFKSDLSSKPPILSMVPGLINDIKSYFLKIVENNKTFTDYFNSKVDIKFYEEKVENKSLGLQDLYNFFIFCFNKIKELGPPIRDKKIDDKIENIHKDMENISELDLKTFLITQFKDIISNLELILDEKNFIINSSDKNNTADKNTNTE